MDSSRSGLLSTLLMTLPLIIVPSIALLRPAGGPAGVAQTVAQGAQTPDDSPDDFFDGLDTGEPADLARELSWLKRHSRSLLWLNPLLRFDGYAPLARGASVLHRHADAMLAVHNLSRLEELAASLRQLLRG